MDVVVENLTKSFGVQKAIDSVSFTARKGEVLGFLGPNGAGKTTTMKVMACFLLTTGTFISTNIPSTNIQEKSGNLSVICRNIIHFMKI